MWFNSFMSQKEIEYMIQLLNCDQYCQLLKLYSAIDSTILMSDRDRI